MSDDSSIEQLRAILVEHRPTSASEQRSRSQTLAYLDWLASPLDEFADPTHVTSSGVVLAEDDGPARIVLHRHKRLGRWLQPGGHIDAGEGPAAAAIREVVEETGLQARHPRGGPVLVHIDVHQGPRGHVHLDTRWLLLASGDVPFEPADGESPDVAWFTSEAACAVSDPGMVEAIGRAVALFASGSQM